MEKFKKGERAYSLHYGQFGIIKDGTFIRDVMMYTMTGTRTQKLYACKEEDLMTVYEHDVHFGLIPKPSDS